MSSGDTCDDGSHLPGGRRQKLFFFWLLAFYSIWTSVVAIAGQWALVRENWPISVAMAGSSFVAGSNPVAGGTVGFPLLVYLFGHPARLGRQFSLAIQSIGMVSASIYILKHGRRLEWQVLKYAIFGSAVAMPLGLAFVVPVVPDVIVKILFSSVYAGFGLLHIIRSKEISANRSVRQRFSRADACISVLVGIVVGLLAYGIGVGADILLYCLLVLLYHDDIKVAIPTSVVFMAFNSVVGAACTLMMNAWSPGRAGRLSEVYPYWLAAVPVVVLGGPVGSFVSRYVPRRAILGVVSFLCLAQFGVTCHSERISGPLPFVLSSAVVLVNLGLLALFAFGYRYVPIEPALSSDSSRSVPK